MGCGPAEGACASGFPGGHRARRHPAAASGTRSRRCGQPRESLLGQSNPSRVRISHPPPWPSPGNKSKGVTLSTGAARGRRTLIPSFAGKAGNGREYQFCGLRTAHFAGKADPDNVNRVPVPITREVSRADSLACSRRGGLTTNRHRDESVAFSAVFGLPAEVGLRMAAEALNLSPTTAYRQVRNGDFPCQDAQWLRALSKYDEERINWSEEPPTGGSHRVGLSAGCSVPAAARALRPARMLFRRQHPTARLQRRDQRDRRQGERQQPARSLYARPPSRRAECGAGRLFSDPDGCFGGGRTSCHHPAAGNLCPRSAPGLRIGANRCRFRPVLLRRRSPDRGYELHARGGRARDRLLAGAKARRRSGSAPDTQPTRPRPNHGCSGLRRGRGDRARAPCSGCRSRPRGSPVHGRPCRDSRGPYHPQAAHMCSAPRHRALRAGAHQGFRRPRAGRPPCRNGLGRPRDAREATPLPAHEPGRPHSSGTPRCLRVGRQRSHLWRIPATGDVPRRRRRSK